MTDLVPFTPALSQVRFKGLTGFVEFDGRTGERLVPDGIDIMNVVSQDVIQVRNYVIKLKKEV